MKRPKPLKNSDDLNYVLQHKKGLLVNALALSYACRLLEDQTKIPFTAYVEMIGRQARNYVDSLSPVAFEKAVQDLIVSMNQGNPQGFAVIKSQPPDEAD
jgi:hypothetical protein